MPDRARLVVDVAEALREEAGDGGVLVAVHGGEQRGERVVVAAGG